TPAGAMSVVISGIQPYAAGTPLDIQGMAIDAAGDLFYSDASYGRVIQLAPPYTGTPTVLASGLGYPAAVAVDASGNVFVEDATGNRVVKISPSGTQTTVATGLHGGTALAVDGAGNLLISDGTTTNVLLLAPPYTGTPTVVTTGHSVQGLTFAPSTGVGSPTQAVTLKSTVISSPVGASPSGAVTFTEGSTTLGTVGLSGGTPNVATLSTSLAIGTHTVTAQYGGSGNFPASTSPPFTVVVSPNPVPVTVTGSREYGGTTYFTYAPPASLPSGVIAVSGTLSGCTSSAPAPLGSYSGTIGGCTGLTLTGPNAGNYAPSYTDAGVTVIQAPLPVSVNGTKPAFSGGSPTFTSTPPSPLPAGVTGFSGSLSGCSSSVTDTDVSGTYAGTISGCGGLSLTGTGAGNYAIAYVDAGVVLTRPTLAMTVKGTKIVGNSATFVYEAPDPLPAGLTAITGTMSGCHTSAVTSTFGTYAGTISGCGGLSATGPGAGSYQISYVDGGLVVRGGDFKIIVTGSQPPGGSSHVSFSWSMDALPDDPDVYGIYGNVVDCTSTVPAGAPVGSYAGTISGCGGIQLTGPGAANYPISYVDGGVKVEQARTGVTLDASGQPAPDAYIADGVNGTFRLSPPYSGTPHAFGGGVDAPSGAAVDAAGHIFLTDRSLDFHGKVREFNPDGTLVQVISGGMVNPMGIALDTAGNLFVTDDTSGKVVRFVPPYTAAPTTVASGLRYPSDVAVDSAGNAFIVTDGEVYEVAPPYTGAPIPLIKMNRPTSVALDAAGNLYIASGNNGPGGGMVQMVAPPYTGSRTQVVSGFDRSYGVDVDVAGNLIVADDAGSVYYVTGGVTTQVTENLAAPRAVAFGHPASRVVRGDPVTFTATVLSGAVTNSASGHVDFYDGATLLGTGTLSSALGTGATVATFTTSGLGYGSHSVTAIYRGDDGSAGSTSPAATVVVPPPTPAAPTADADSATTAYDTQLTVPAPGVLDNDTGTGNTVTGHTEPGHGTLAIDADGSFTYTPDAGWVGDDTFGYTLTDGFERSETATVTVTTSQPDAPEAVDDSFTPDYGTALLASAPGVLDNDTGTGNTVTGHTEPGHGTLAIDADGSFTYTPADGWGGADTFDYTLADAFDRTSTATVTVTTGSPAGPVAEADSYTASYATQLTVEAPGVLTNDTGVGVSVSSNADASHGTAAVDGDGSFTYTPADGWVGEDTFDYTVTDAFGHEATSQVAVTTDLPALPVAEGDSYSATYETPLTIDPPGLLANDSGVGTRVISSTDAAHGTVDMVADGSFTYSPAAGWAGEDTFEYTMMDAFDRPSSAATVTITTDMPDLPTAVDDFYVARWQEATTAFAPGVLLNDSGAGLTVTDHTDPLHGTVTLDADGKTVYAPADGWAGDDAFDYTATDAFGRSSTATVNVTTMPIPPPVGRLTIAKTDFVVGESVAITVTIATRPKTAAPTGVVLLTIDGTTLYVDIASKGRAFFSTRALAIGTHEISAVYGGDFNYNSGRAGETTVTVAQGSTGTVVTSRTEPVPSGKAAVLAATTRRVAPASGATLAGSATFTATSGSGTEIVVTVPTGSTGGASWRPKLPDGTWTITATYLGNDDFATSTSQPLTIHVGGRG
ncbi:MAG: hypothetical protein JWM89_3274, partial [Acidimicrobiales bacterium]|nr:hypothetical protein [Acidimicrobiales bacterium]